MSNKRKISLSLDADLVEAFEQEAADGLSAQINDVLRAEVDRRRHHRALRALLDELTAQDGPLGPEDEAEIARFERLLRGERD